MRVYTNEKCRIEVKDWYAEKDKRAQVVYQKMKNLLPYMKYGHTKAERIMFKCKLMGVKNILRAVRFMRKWRDRQNGTQNHGFYTGLQ